MASKPVIPALREIPLPPGAAEALKASAENYELISKAADKLVQFFREEAEHAQFMEASTQRQLNLTLQRIAMHQTEAQQLQTLQKAQDHDSRDLADLNKREVRTEKITVAGSSMLEPIDQEVKPGLTRTEKEDQARLTEAIGARAMEIDRLKNSIKAKADAEKDASVAQARAAEEALAAKARVAEEARVAQERAAAEQKKVAEEQAAARKKEDEDRQAATVKAAQLKQDNAAIRDIIQNGKDWVAYLDQQIALNDKNPKLTDGEKYTNRTKFLKWQTGVINGTTEALNSYQPVQDELDEANRKAIETAAEGFQQKKNKIAVDRLPPSTHAQSDAKAVGDLADPAKHYQSIGDGIAGSLQQQVAKIGTLGDQIAGVFTTVGDTIRKSLGSAFADAILKGGTFHKTMTNISRAVVTSFVQSGAQMVADWLWQHTAMAAVKKLFTAQDIATHGTGEAVKVAQTTAGQLGQTTAHASGATSRGIIKIGETIFHGIQIGIQTAASIAGELAQTAITVAQAPLRIASMLAESGVKLVSAALGAMAAMSSIPYVGPFLAIAAMAGIIAAGSKLLHREQGGPVSAGQAYIVGEKRPEVFVPNADGFIIPSVAQAMTRPGYAPGGRGGGGGGDAGGSPGQRPVNVYPLMADDRGSIERAQRDPYSDAHFVHMLKKHRRVIGVKA